MPVSFAKLEEADPSGNILRFRKAADTAAKTIFGKNVGMFGHEAKCGLAMDVSGSEAENYRNGSMQALAERVLALATKFDDDGEIDVFPFGTDAHKVEQVNISNYGGRINQICRVGGYTNYAAVVEKVAAFYGYDLYGRHNDRKLPAALPAYVVFQSDGRPYDGRSETKPRDAARKAFIAASHLPIFWVLAGIGDENSAEFDFMREIDAGLKGRLLDNASFFAFPDVRHVSDDALYTKMLIEYPSWVEQAKDKEYGLIAA